MKDISAIAQIYQIFEKAEGTVRARETVSSILYVTIAEIQDEGLEVSSEILEQRLRIEADKLVQASKKIA